MYAFIKFLPVWLIPLCFMMLPAKSLIAQRIAAVTFTEEKSNLPEANINIEEQIIRQNIETTLLH